MPEVEGELVATYTRAQALADGVLIDISAHATEAGIRVPTAVTLAVWNDYIQLTLAAEKAGNDISGRTRDIVGMCHGAAKRMPNTSELLFELDVVMDRIKPSRVALKAVIGPGDNGEPVLTILERDED